MPGTTFSGVYGWAEIEPKDPVVAGSMGTWRLTYHVGEYGVDDGGTIKIATRFASDWGYPQMDDPKAANYLTATTTGQAKLRARYDPRGYIRPWQKCLIINVYDAALAPGDEVIVTYGYTSGGSPGSMAQTFCEKAFEFKVAVDSFGTGQFVELESPPILEIISGPPTKLVAILPSQVATNEPFSLSVKAEDRWGNPCSSYRGEVAFEDVEGLTGFPKRYAFLRKDKGVHRFEGLRLERPGVYRVKVVDEAHKLKAESNSTICQVEKPKYRPYWGDLHGQSEETVGTNTVDDYFRYARDVSILDFSSHQGNAFQITKDTWREIQLRVRQYNEPHRFVTFLGYEWSGNSPAGGDRNVYYLKDDEPIHRCSHWQIADRSDVTTDRYPVTALYETLRFKEAIIIPHVGGRPANLDFHDPELEPLVEIYSAWGQFEWFLRDALRRGYRVGFVAGSDDHKGRPGASYPGSSTFGVYGGLVCAYAKELTREAIWEALRSRRCYATAGGRIILRSFADGHWMGEEYHTGRPPKITVDVIGTDLIEKVEVMRGLERAYTCPSGDDRLDDRIRVSWSGARIKGRGRIARWDGELEIDKGRIIEVEGYAFDSPVERVTQTEERKVSWRSSTAGDEDGVILKLDAPKETKIRFETEIIAFSLSLGEIYAKPITIDAGGLDLKVALEKVPAGTGQRRVHFEFVDHEIRRGCNPYYVRVTQNDGAKAWSSPIYVHY